MNLLRFILPFLLFSSIYAQNGGLNSFSFMKFTNAARLEAMGGYALSIYDQDASLGVMNPAILNPEHHGQLNINYVNYFADSDYGFSSYAFHLKNIGTISTSILYANYGKFDYADALGVHHLPNHLEGLESLKSALPPIGGMGMMVYAYLNDADSNCRCLQTP